MLDDYLYPEIKENNDDINITQDDYGNYNIGPSNNEENENNNSIDEDEEINEEEEFHYRAVKNINLKVNVTDTTDVDPNDVIVKYNGLGNMYGNTMNVDVINNPITVLPGFKVQPNQENHDGVRYSSMKKVKFNLKDYGFTITASDLKYDSDTPGHFKIIVPTSLELDNQGVDYLGFQRLTYYLEGLRDASKVLNNLTFPVECVVDDKTYYGGIIPYNISVNNNGNVIIGGINILPPNGYESMEKVTSFLNLRDIYLPNKSVLEYVVQNYFRYNYNISELEEEYEDVIENGVTKRKYKFNSGIKDINLGLKNGIITRDSVVRDNNIIYFKLTDYDKQYHEVAVNTGTGVITKTIYPCIGFKDDIIINLENVNFNRKNGNKVETPNTVLAKKRRINGEIIPVPENRNLKRGRGVEDEYSTQDGVTTYDENEKCYYNVHEYTIDQENDNLDEMDELIEHDYLAFEKCLQVTKVPIMDTIRWNEINNNGLLTVSIDDFNNMYADQANSLNSYRDDFLGFDTVKIPININNKTIPLIATVPGIYRPSDIDPTAIGFSSVQVSDLRSGGGSGGDSSSGSVNNLQNYVFRGNTVHPYTIREYNNSQYPPTDYTGFDAIIVDTNSDLEVLDVNVNKLGKYSLAYGDVENIMPVMNANTTDDIILSGTPQWNSSNLTWYRLFDGNTTGENGFHSSTSISEGYLKIQFLNEKKSFNYFNCYAYSSYPGRAPTHIVVEGSDDDDAYIELFNGNIAYVNLQSLQNVLVNTGEYYYYKFTFSYSDGKSDYIEFTELQLMEYSIGGYKGVNVNVDLDNLMLSHSGTVENIENNTSNTYYPFDVLTSVIPVMNSYNSNGASIIDVVGNASNLERFFDGNMYGNWVYLNSDDVSFVLSLDNPVVPRSIFFTFYYGSNNSVGEIKIYGSNDNLDYTKIFEITDVYKNSYFLKNEDNYIYENIDNENSYSYLKFELKRNLSNNVSYTREIRIFDVDKYFGFDKFTIVNNTYSKTADPICNNFNSNNQTVNVQTLDTTTYPYVRRGNMTVPLEDKVIKYKGFYNPVNINVSNGYYGIRSVTFEDEGVYVCEPLFENNAEIGVNVSNDNYRYDFNGGYITTVWPYNCVNVMFDNNLNNCEYRSYGAQCDIEIFFDQGKNLNCVKLYNGNGIGWTEVNMIVFVNNEAVDFGTVRNTYSYNNTWYDFNFFTNNYYSNHYKIYFTTPLNGGGQGQTPCEVKLCHCESDTSPFELINRTITENGNYVIQCDQDNYVAIREVDLNVNIPIQNIKNVNIPTYGDTVILPDGNNKGIAKVNLSFEKPNYVSSVNLIDPSDVPADTIHVTSTNEYYFSTGAFKLYCNQNERYFNRLFFDENSLQYVDMENIDLVIECNQACIINSFALFAVGTSGYAGKPSFYVSIDGSNWNLLYHSDEEIEFNSWSEFNFVNDKIYKWYKITTDCDGGYIRFARIQYCEESGYVAPTKPLYPNYALTYNDSGVYQISPPNGYDGFSSATLTVNVPLQQKSVTLTTWGNHGWNYFYPDSPNKGFSSFAVYLTNDPEYKLSDFKLYYKQYTPSNSNINVDIDGSTVTNISINNWKEYNVNNSTYRLRAGYGIIYMTTKWQHVDINMILNNNVVDTTDPDYDPSLTGSELLTMDIQTQTVEHSEPYSWKVFISEFPLQYMLNGNDEIEGEITLSYQTSGRIIMRNIYNKIIGLNSSNIYLYDSWINKSNANVTIIN